MLKIVASGVFIYIFMLIFICTFTDTELIRQSKRNLWPCKEMMYIELGFKRRHFSSSQTLSNRWTGHKHCSSEENWKSLQHRLLGTSHWTVRFYCY